jgi:nucleoid-associated protein YgaU
LADASSRYSAVGTAIWTSPTGESVLFRQRRFLPQAGTLPVLTEVTVQHGQRLDQIAAAKLGNALQWWRIADANVAMEPYALTSRAGVVLIVPVPTAST